MQEIERKFFVRKDFNPIGNASFIIKQGFLNSDPSRTVRIRIKGEKGFITVKGAGNESGTTRFEWEKEIGVEEATMLLNLCEHDIIEKTRFVIPVDKHLFEVDVFEGDNKGLVIAEVELSHENEQFTKPEWLGEEVTGQTRYYNSSLSKRPYRKW